MNEEFDMGDIILQQRVPVDDKDTVTDLFHKTIVLFAPIALEALTLIESGRTAWTEQDPWPGPVSPRRRDRQGGPAGVAAGAVGQRLGGGRRQGLSTLVVG